MVVIQAWMLMITYVNHCCQWRWYEYVLVILKMSAAVLLTQTINNDPDTSSVPSLASMAFMITCIIALYLIEYKKSDRHKEFAKHNLLILSLIEIVYIIAIGLRILVTRRSPNSSSS